MKKDIRYVPTPSIVVQAMLDLAEVGPKDLLFDLGSGDGRLVIEGARRGARGVGIDIDHRLVTRSIAGAREAGVSGLTSFRVGNFHQADLGGATVVMLYLRGAINRRLLPKLLAELDPGTVLISHAFEMGDWRAEKTVEVDARFLYKWTIP